jgi:diguanylate cyclase (GGDEF)-like protein
VANAMRKQRKLAVLYFDLDGFKAINDRFGHTAGDQLLHKISQRAQNELRAGDYLARYGGDEFILLIDEIAESAEAGVIAKKIIHAVSLPVVFENGDEGRVSASVGISLFPEDDTRPERLIQMADEAMYRAKQAGKAKFRYHARTVPEAI